MIPLRVLGDRILVQPDEDRNAPELLASGIHIAKTLSAAVTGEDRTWSVQRGTVIAVGNPRHPRKEDAEHLADALCYEATGVGFAPELCLEDIGPDDAPELHAAMLLLD